ncbi:hypothetical protein [Paenibacillus koleovorans]|uniref:hypothetical protein n=1 Tax=Paenibacillus koleovorans TaxID=121608 RepID=UPI000FDAE176|nr:hypothetical protein [Paenibacillus koleovorans]
MPKRITLDNQAKDTLWKLLHGENDVIVDVYGTEVRMTVNRDHSFIPEDIAAEIEADPELKQMLLDSEEDIIAGRVYTTEEAIRFIKDYHSK